MKFILLMFIFSRGVALETQEFNTQEACENAIVDIREGLVGVKENSNIALLCVPKGETP